MLVKHLVAILLGLLSLIGIYYFIEYNSQPLSFQVKKNVPTPSSAHAIVNGPSQKMLFVPYWGIDSHTLPVTYDSLIYFGITVNASGVDTQEVGYKDLSLFLKKTPERTKKILTIRMINNAMNTSVLKDRSLQQKIITDSLQIAKDNGFLGVVLDLEYNALAFDSVVQSITSFSSQFAKDAHAENLLFYQSVYGDTFYRLRPYDVEALAKNADGIVVMAYDFHKANGDAGPNFPLSGKETQGYDLKTMVGDFEAKVPTEKLIVVFGTYGYDWQVDKNNHSEQPATALSLTEIESKFLIKCPYNQCVVQKDQVSQETKVTYSESGNNHIVWFDDLTSIAQKSAYLHTQGINAIALWAYSYF
jgi:spore germination protein YaaH